MPRSLTQLSIPFLYSKLGAVAILNSIDLEGELLLPVLAQRAGLLQLRREKRGRIGHERGAGKPRFWGRGFRMLPTMGTLKERRR